MANTPVSGPPAKKVPEMSLVAFHHTKMEIVKYAAGRSWGSRDRCIAILEETGYDIGIRLIERMCASRHRFPSQREILKYVCKDVWSNLFQKQADRLQTNRKGSYVVHDTAFSWIQDLPFMTDKIGVVAARSPIALSETGQDPGAVVKQRLCGSTYAVPKATRRFVPDDSLGPLWLLPAAQLGLACGILKGVLGILLDSQTCAVTAEASPTGACLFQVSVTDAPQVPRSPRHGTVFSTLGDSPKAGSPGSAAERSGL